MVIKGHNTAILPIADNFKSTHQHQHNRLVFHKDVEKIHIHLKEKRLIEKLI